MVRVVVGLAALVLFTAASLLAEAQAPAPEGPTLSPLWNLSGDFNAPESAYYDAGADAVFVSSINGQILEKDGNGYISRLSTDGKVVSAKWVTGLNAPKGLRSVGGTLWVSDIDEVVAIDIATARIVRRVRVEGSQFLNDLATSADGTVYVSDSALSRIYQVKDGVSSVFVEGADVVEQPNGLLVEGGRLVLGTIGPGPGGHLFAFDLRSKARTMLTTERVGGIDGIEPDGRGGLLVTDVIGMRLLRVDPSGAVRVLARFTLGGADFGYVARTRTAIVPFLFGNNVSAFDLTAALR